MPDIEIDLRVSHVFRKNPAEAGGGTPPRQHALGLSMRATPLAFSHGSEKKYNYGLDIGGSYTLFSTKGESTGFTAWSFFTGPVFGLRFLRLLTGYAGAGYALNIQRRDNNARDLNHGFYLGLHLDVRLASATQCYMATVDDYGAMQLKCCPNNEYAPRLLFGLALRGFPDRAKDGIGMAEIITSLGFVF